MTRVLGLDLSLTATGYAYSEEVVGAWRVKQRGEARLVLLRDAVLNVAEVADVVVLEGYSYASPNQAHQIGELGGVVRVMLHERHIPFVEVAPATLKRFATGKGNATKDAVLAAAIRRFGFEGSDNNEADAWLLRAMGLEHYLGSSIPLRPAYMAEALERVDWPELDIPRVTEAERAEAQRVRGVIAEADSTR